MAITFVPWDQKLVFTVIILQELDRTNNLQTYITQVCKVAIKLLTSKIPAGGST
jgi:hypothetical protein